MATVDERVQVLEEKMGAVATQNDVGTAKNTVLCELGEVKKQMESRLYTALSEMEGRMKKEINSRFDEVLEAIKKHSHP